MPGDVILREHTHQHQQETSLQTEHDPPAIAILVLTAVHIRNRLEFGESYHRQQVPRDGQHEQYHQCPRYESKRKVESRVALDGRIVD